MNKIELKKFIDENPKLVTMRESTRFPGLYVLKYKRKVFYDNLWNDYLMDCRGTVVDENMNVRVRPFTKVFNFGENGTTIHRDAAVIAVRKVNGFMFTLTQDPHRGMLAGTTGSLDSEFVDMGKLMVKQETYDYVKAHEGITFIFEVCHPDDPHIIKEPFGLYLIGARVADWDGYSHGQIRLDVFAEEMGVMRPEWSIYPTFSEVLKEIKDVKHEGFMVYSKDTCLKIKSPYYLTSKFLARMGPAKLARFIDNPKILYEAVEEEFYPLVDKVVEQKEHFLSLDEQGRLSYIEGVLNESISI